MSGAGNYCDSALCSRGRSAQQAGLGWGGGGDTVTFRGGGDTIGGGAGGTREHTYLKLYEDPEYDLRFM